MDDTYDPDFFGGCHDFDHHSSFDEEEDELEDEAPLSWRLDPSQSLSDWTIKIRHSPSGITNIYHVHKNILAVGPKKSEYFCGLFRNHHHSSILIDQYQIKRRDNNNNNNNNGRGSQQQQFAESVLDTSDITLEDMAADAFPRVLDFMYSSSNALYVTTENAIALRFLAQYFGIRLLHKHVMEFLRHDIKNVSNLNSYLCDSVLFQDEKISGFVAETCAINILEISPTCPLLYTLGPDFFLHILSSPEIDTCSVSTHISSLVASYCTIHKNELDEETFYKITHRKHIPCIGRDAALQLLELEADLIQRKKEKQEEKEERKEKELQDIQQNKSNKNGEEEEQLNITNDTTATTETTTKTSESELEYPELDELSLPLPLPSLIANRSKMTTSSSSLIRSGGELSCLQKRCVKVLALHWKEISDKGRIQSSSIFEKLPSSVVLDLLDKSLNIAKQRLDEATRSVEVQRIKLEQEFDVRLAKAIEKYEKEHYLLERVQRDTTERISQLRLQLADRDRELAEYRQELNRFCRLPTSYSFHDIKRSTYHHLSQSEPFDHQPSVARYGRRRPTALPRHGDKSEDGYLYVTELGNSFHERWPVYYYKDD